MPGTYQTPGVYLQETAALPPGVVAVPTAVPAFLGYTATGPALVPTQVGSLQEYEQTFGGPPTVVLGVVVTQDAAGAVSCTPTLARKPDTPLLHASLQLYFDNGGGPCYVVSIGGHGDAVTLQAFTDALAELRNERGPTLVVMPDATRLTGHDFAAVCGAALDHCGALQDRFAILDVRRQQSAADFRAVASDSLAYGAAYLPYLRTSLEILHDEKQLPVTLPGGSAALVMLRKLKKTNLAVYNQVKATLAKLTWLLPPSGAVAGVCARTDREQGVWKAPANVALASVLGPDRIVTDAETATLNVDPVGGKSLNAIRSFAGRGTLVWGARTLAGNSEDWRYVPVRRLLIMVETSLRNALQGCVFEPNAAATWTKVQAMIESFLFSVWKQGALMGAKPQEGYFVRVGLGSTMTAQDVLDGHLKIQLGLATMRPSEFIIVSIRQQMQGG